jgi:hypothetical protein
MNGYTNIVYQNPKVEVIVSDDYASLRTKSAIECGDLIMIEHVIVANDPAIVVNIVSQNEELYRILYPRHPNEQRSTDNATSKVMSNMFRIEGNYALGKTISMINHNCNPNALCTHSTIDAFDIPVSFLIVYALRDIPDGEEICIMYSTTVGHEDTNTYHTFHCNCNQTLEERTRTHELSKGLLLTNAMYKKHQRFLMEYVNHYSSDRSLAYYTHKDIEYLRAINQHIEIFHSDVDNDVIVAHNDQSTCTTHSIKDIILLQYLAMQWGIYSDIPHNYNISMRYVESVIDKYNVNIMDSDVCSEQKYDIMCKIFSDSQNKIASYLESSKYL